MDDEYIFSPGRKINDINEIYKGDGVNTCKYCGNTGWMHTWSNDGYFYSDAPCFCKFGRLVQEMPDKKHGVFTKKEDSSSGETE